MIKATEQTYVSLRRQKVALKRVPFSIRGRWLRLSILRHIHYKGCPIFDVLCPRVGPPNPCITSFVHYSPSLLSRRGMRKSPIPIAPSALLTFPTAHRCSPNLYFKFQNLPLWD